MKKKLFFLILTLCALLCTVAMAPGTAALSAASDGYVYLSTKQDVLDLMATPSLWGKTIYLENDINLESAAGQTTIGTSADAAFTGTFNGQGHTISGIKLSGAKKVAFFGQTKNATI